MIYSDNNHKHRVDMVTTKLWRQPAMELFANIRRIRIFKSSSNWVTNMPVICGSTHKVSASEWSDEALHATFTFPKRKVAHYHHWPIQWGAKDLICAWRHSVCFLCVSSRVELHLRKQLKLAHHHFEIPLKHKHFLNTVVIFKCRRIIHFRYTTQH